MADEQVIVVLDRNEAGRLDALLYLKGHKTTRKKVRAALDRDRDGLVAQVAHLIDDGVSGRLGSIFGPRDLAKVVLAAIEGADTTPAPDETGGK